VGGEAQLPFGGMKATGVAMREMAASRLISSRAKSRYIDFTGRKRESSIY